MNWEVYDERKVGEERMRPWVAKKVPARARAGGGAGWDGGALCCSSEEGQWRWNGRRGVCPWLGVVVAKMR